MKEAQPIADAGAHAADPAHALRANAAASGEDDAPAPLAPEEADRFAMAFRPSWEPLAGDQAAAPSTRPSIAAPRRTSLPPPAPVHDPVQDELLRLRGRRARSRSIGLAAVSVLSFSALVYWGISTTTSGTERATTRGLVPPPAAEATPAADAPAIELARAPKSESTGLIARLADPNEPERVAPQAEGEAQEPAPAAEGAATGSEPAAAEQQAAAPAQEQAAAASAAPAAAASAAPAAAPAAAPSTPAAAPVVAAPTAAPAAVAPAAAPAAPAQLAAAPAAPAATAASAPAAPAPKPTAAPTTPAAAPKPPAAQPTPAEQKPTAAIAAAPAPSAPAPQKTGDPARPPLLQVRAVPDGAQLWLDGQRMTNPFDTRLPLGSKHKLEAKQEGFETSSQTIRIESDARLTITLRQTPTAAPNIKKPQAEGSRGAGFVTSNPY